MNAAVKAIYRDGVFVPETACDLPENSQVELLIQGPVVIPPSITDPEERASIRKRVVERMRRNPIPSNAPRLTRDQLHDRG